MKDNDASVLSIHYEHRWFTKNKVYGSPSDSSSDVVVVVDCGLNVIGAVDENLPLIDEAMVDDNVSPVDEMVAAVVVVLVVVAVVPKTS